LTICEEVITVNSMTAQAVRRLLLVGKIVAVQYEATVSIAEIGNRLADKDE